MSLDEPSGFKYIPLDHEVRRWQHLLFSEVRKVERYRQLIQPLVEITSCESNAGWPRGQEFAADLGCLMSSLKFDGVPVIFGEDGSQFPFYVAAEPITKHLGLTKNGRPAYWALNYLYMDSVGRFEGSSPVLPWTPIPDEIQIPVDREMRDRFALLAGDPEWDQLEDFVVQRARDAVAALKREYEHSQRDWYYTPMRRKAGNEQSREIQIVRLALRLTRRHGTRNSPKIDARWCDFLEIDVPRER